MRATCEWRQSDLNSSLPEWPTEGCNAYLVKRTRKLLEHGVNGTGGVAQQSSSPACTVPELGLQQPRPQHAYFKWNKRLADTPRAEREWNDSHITSIKQHPEAQDCRHSPCLG